MESGSSISALLLSGTISFGIRFASLCFRLAFRPSTKPYEDISYDTSCPSIIGFISVLALIPLQRRALLWSICILQNKCIQTASAVTIIIAYNMAVSQMKSPKIVDIYGLPGHCFVRVDSGKQCNPGRIAKSLLVGSAPKPLKTRAALCGCVVFLRHSTFWLRLKSKKEKPLCQLSCCEQHLTQGLCYRSGFSSRRRSFSSGR